MTLALVIAISFVVSCVKRFLAQTFNESSIRIKLKYPAEITQKYQHNQYDHSHRENCVRKLTVIKLIGYSHNKYKLVK
jgi:hypothetical protein